MPQSLVRGSQRKRLDVVTVGHVTVDRIEGSLRIGGAAAYAARAAARLGYAAGAVTSVGRDFPFWDELGDVEVHYNESARTTEFENVYGSEGRRQRVLAVAAPLREADLGPLRERVREDTAVLYCPVVHEIELPLQKIAPRGLVGVAPQGFFRRWERGGEVSPRTWKEAKPALRGADVVTLSEEDATSPEKLAEGFPGAALVVTRGASGCRVYARGKISDVPPFPAREVDPTGAGDVFAVALLLALREGRSLPDSVRFAQATASLSVERAGLAALPTRDEVAARLG